MSARVLFVSKRKARTRNPAALVHALRSQGLRVMPVNCHALRRWAGRRGAAWIVRRLRAAWRPDLCFVFYTDLPRPLLDEIAAGVPTVVWFEDERVALDAATRDYFAQAHLVCCTSPRVVAACRAAGVARAAHLLSGFSERFHRPLAAPGPFERDVAFIGGPGNPELGDRPGLLTWLAERTDLTIFGRRKTWRPHLARHPGLRVRHEVGPRGYARVCARSRIVLGQNQGETPLYFSNRLFLTLACRGFLLTNYVAGMEHLFENHRHLVWFRDRDECLHWIAHYRTRDAERQAIAEAGHALVRAQHRYGDRMREVLGILAGTRPAASPLDDGETWQVGAPG